MKAKISKIILWSKHKDLPPRMVQFEMRGVEVITGKSQTGKSALIPIIDYCLGSEKCAIPVGEIRDNVEWFGVVLRLPESEMLLARRNPGLHAQTTEMYFDSATEIVVPNSLNDLQTVSLTSVVGSLNQLAGLPSLSLTGGDEGGFGGRPSFRDTAAFQFQPQHIVANPYTLFFKADTYEHQEKLKNVFPLILGVIDNAALEARRQLRTLETEIKQVRDQLDDRKLRSATWTREFRDFYSQAREYGLLPEVQDPKMDWTTEKFVGFLSLVPFRLKQNPFPQIERGASRRIAKEIGELRKAEDSISRSLEDRKRKLSRIDRLRNSTDGYSQTLGVQGQRLQPLPWFADHIADAHACPVCGSASDSAAKEVIRLENLAREVAASVGTIDSVNHVLDKEAASLEDELRKLEQEINEVRMQLTQRETMSEDLRSHRQTLNNIHNFAGRLEQELKKYAESDQGFTLVEKLKKLESQATSLRMQHDPISAAQRQEAALDRISESIRHYCEILGVENYERRARIDIRNLTLAIEGPQGRKDFLWEIGSGANWMGYHVATLLSLHEYFLWLSSKGSSPVPQFLIIDQPSQAFFPESRVNHTGKSALDEPELDSDDTTRVQRIFRALTEAVRRTKGRLQIVLIDHVGEAAWEGIPGVRVVERWRGDDALIPLSWRKPL